MIRPMTFNLRDWFERVGWTAIQAGLGAGLDLFISGEVSWRAIGYAAAIAAVKVLIAQNIGERPSGDLLPGGPTVEPVDE